MEPRLLILETSGKVGQVALAEGSRLLSQRRLDDARRHARDLAPATAVLLAEQGWRPRDLHGVVVSRGPGSYTGLRVGIMSAKTLAYATGCALIAVDTFDAIAAQAPAEVATLEAIADAQQERVYHQRFARDGTAMRATSDLAISTLADWLQVCATRPTSHASGPALRLHAARVAEVLTVVDESLWEPTLDSLLRLGLDRFQAGKREEVWSLEPLYLRPSSAEENWEKKGRGGR